MSARIVRDLNRYKFPPQPHYTVHACFCDYSRERIIGKGKNAERVWCGFNNFMDVVRPEAPAESITSGQVEDYVDRRLAQRVVILTARRELVFVKAALHHALRRNRIEKLPQFDLPDGELKERRPLREDEFKLVMRQVMTPRLRKFYKVAYHTGHRAGAIEELTWDRVNFVKLTIDFNVPGRRTTNKKRCADFPINDDFLALLKAWKARAKDAFVIGAGPNTYHEADYVVRELAGLTDPSLVPRHCMRKMFATDMFEQGANPEVVGHLMADDPDMLRKHYIKFKDSTLRGVANLRSKAQPLA